jgi:hypothetical protein
MFNRFVQNADKVLIALHTFVWTAVMVVWVFAWRNAPGPMGPPYSFAKQFISRVDVLIAPQMDALSVRLAMNTAKFGKADIGLTFTIIFGCMILLGGTLQWLLVGHLLRWIAAKYGKTSSILFSACVASWIIVAFISWAMSW